MIAPSTPLTKFGLFVTSPLVFRYGELWCNILAMMERNIIPKMENTQQNEAPAR
jgi:hypothetical protein